MAFSQLKDYELVKKFIDGDMDSIQVLIDRHKKRVFTYILLTVKDHQLAEDIFQDTFIKVIKSLREQKYRDNGTLVAWITRIAHNLIIDHFRKLKNQKTFSADKCDINPLNLKKLADENIEDLLINEQIVADLRKLVELLPSEQKEMILLRHYGGLSFKEIADLTGISINTALGRMRYAIMNLRKMINKHNIILSKE